MYGYRAARSIDASSYDGAVGVKDNDGRVRRFRDSESYNVKDYGAVGDGETDDTDAINAALDAVCATGGLLVFPPGTYVVTNNCVISAGDVTIKGYKARLKVNTVWRNSQVVGGDRVAGIFDIWTGDASTPANNIVIQDLEFEGTEDGTAAGTPLPGTEGDPKAITSNSSASHITIQNCRFYNFGHETIWPTGTVREYWRVLDNHFENDDMDSMEQGSTIQCNFDKSIVRGNTIINSCSAIGASGNDLEICGNVIITPGLEGIGIGDGVGTGLRCNVHGNVIKLNNNGAITVGSPARGIAVGGAGQFANIHGNTIEITIVNIVRGGPRGIWIASTGTTHVVANNRVVIDQDELNYGALGIHMEGNGSSTQAAVITGNSISLINPYGTPGGGAAYGIATTTGGAGDSMKAVIANNFVEGMTRANNCYAIDCNQNAGGTMQGHGLGNVCTEGHRRFNASGYSTSATDNLPVWISTAGTPKFAGMGTTAAPVNVIPQAAPSSPVNGDVWVDTGDNTLKVRINGATRTVTTS